MWLLLWDLPLFMYQTTRYLHYLILNSNIFAFCVIVRLFVLRCVFGHKRSKGLSNIVVDVFVKALNHTAFAISW